MDPFLTDEAPEGGKFDPLQILRVFWRRRALFFVPFIICAVVAAVAIRTLTPIYESAGQIRVIYDFSRSRLLDDTAPSYGNQQRNIDQETLNAIWTIVTAPRFLEDAAREAGLATEAVDSLSAAVGDGSVVGISSLSRGANRLKRLLRVRQDGTRIYEIAVRSSDPLEARNAAYVVLRMFLEAERQTRMAPKASTRDFLERQLAVAQTDLTTVEQQLNTFEGSLLRSSLGGNPINAVNISGVEVALRSLQEKISTTDRQELQALAAQAQAVSAQLPAAADYLGEPEIATAVQQITSLEQARIVGGQVGGEIENDLGRERLRLSNLLDASVQRRLPAAGMMDRTRIVRYVLQAMRNRAREQAAATVAAGVRDYRDFTARQPAQSAQLTELQLEVQRRRELLARLEGEIAQTNMNIEASISEIGYRIEVRRDPGLPEFPVEPDKLRLYVMGFGLSLAIGLGLVVLSIMLDRSFSDTASIERLVRVPVIGTLPMIQDDHFQKQRKRRLLRWTVLVFAILTVAVVFLFVVYPRLN
jgi:succinoglycan biosynthesis transport protein ExoP